MAVARLSRVHDTDDAELTILVNDAFQGQGLGTEMVKRLLDIGREEKIARVIAHISQENHTMQDLCQRMGFKLNPPKDGRVLAEVDPPGLAIRRARQ